MKESIIEKQCNKCGVVKDSQSFHTSKSAKDGMQPKCKDCARAYNQTPERRAYFASYRSTPEAKASHSEYCQTPKYKAKKAVYDQSIRGRYTFARTSATQRGRDFDIPESFHAELIQQPCHYCYGPLNPYGCGMDRIDGNIGYIIGNVVPCCHSCNTMKSDKLTYDEMMLVWEYRRKQAVV
jgi:hypothetical protein